MSDYLKSIQKFDHSAKPQIVENLARFVEQIANDRQLTIGVPEIESIKNYYCKARLGLDSEKSEAILQEVLEKVHHELPICLVTFCYLVAQRAGKLNRFA